MLLTEKWRVPYYMWLTYTCDLQEIEDHCQLILHFLDEAAGSNGNESWTLELGSDSALKATVSAIRIPWEQLFSVPLQIVNKNISVVESWLLLVLPVLCLTCVYVCVCANGNAICASFAMCNFIFIYYKKHSIPKPYMQCNFHLMYLWRH